MKALVAVWVAGCAAALSLDANGAAPAEVRPAASGEGGQTTHRLPLGPPGHSGRYRHERESGLAGSVVMSYTLVLGSIKQTDAGTRQWMLLHATKANGEQFRVWLLSAGYPPPTREAAAKSTARYLLQEGTAEPLEFKQRFTGGAVLPTLGGWEHLMPRASGTDRTGREAEVFPEEARYLGHRYRLVAREEGSSFAEPPNARRIELLPEVLIGLASNTRQKDETRRYDGSEYEYVRLTRDDYREMVKAGVNCLRVDGRQLPWVQDLNAFYWGVSGNDLPYPECLYRSCYLGPTLFLDEPMVGTRDSVIRPRLAKEAAFRKALTPQLAFEAFQEYFRNALQKGAPTSLREGLATRGDVNLGNLELRQENLFSWETMVSSAAYQLSQDPRVPAAMVFEPPGRIGTRRTVPELNMTYGCQLPMDDPKNLIDIIYGFLRGAARLTDKSWGTSIYGAVDRADAFGFLTHAYDLGATKFFFWDNAQLACVPYGECLALARNLRAHAESNPHRDLERLRHAAEVVILLPPGYNLGHVHLGKGSLWGLDELNLERVNRAGVKYRVVMSNFFAEIERCLRLGVAFDLLWELPGIHPSGYREVVRVREDGRLEVESAGHRAVLDHARAPARPPGAPPQLNVGLSARRGKAPLVITARASVSETSAPVYYTAGADANGIYHNAVVAWELYGPGEEDHRFLMPRGPRPQVSKTGAGYEVLVNLRIPRPGHYRLRAATVDLAGRSTVVWTPIFVSE